MKAPSAHKRDFKIALFQIAQTFVYKVITITLVTLHILWKKYHSFEANAILKIQI